MSIESAPFLKPTQKEALVMGGYSTILQTSEATPIALSRSLQRYAVTAHSSRYQSIQPSTAPQGQETPCDKHYIHHSCPVSSSLPNVTPTASQPLISSGAIPAASLPSSIKRDPLPNGLSLDEALCIITRCKEYILEGRMLAGSKCGDMNHGDKREGAGYHVRSREENIDTNPATDAEVFTPTIEHVSGFPKTEKQEPNIPTIVQYDTNTTNEASASPATINEAMSVPCDSTASLFHTIGNQNYPSTCNSSLALESPYNTRYFSHHLSSQQNNNSQQILSSNPSHPTQIKVFPLTQMLEHEKNHVQRIATFSRDLDAMLGQGIPTGCVTEICGAPGMGKTQLSMQLAVACQLPEYFGGIDGKCLYLDTEGSFVPTRYREIVTGAVAQVQKLANLQKLHPFPSTAVGNMDSSSHISIRKSMDRFSVSSILGSTHYVRVLQQADLLAMVHCLPEIIKGLEKHQQGQNDDVNKKVRLVVIDTIAFHFRYGQGNCTTSGGSIDYAARSRILFHLGQSLQETARKLNVAIVVTNQMTTVTTGPLDPLNAPLGTSSADDSAVGVVEGSVNWKNRANGTLVPALGDSWAHCVSNRVIIKALPAPTNEEIMASLHRQTIDMNIVNKDNIGEGNESVHSPDDLRSSSCLQAARGIVQRYKVQHEHQVRVAILVKSISQCRGSCMFSISTKGIRNAPSAAVQSLL